MVVEDDDRVRRLTARMLRDEGYDVIEARAGQEALKRLAEGSEVHVVLTDIAMPGGMHGVELAERILADSPECQVVLMSGYASLFPKMGTYGTRFPLLIKPFQPTNCTARSAKSYEGSTDRSLSRLQSGQPREDQ
jgi:CheY-like chemotaxis protein